MSATLATILAQAQYRANDTDNKLDNSRWSGAVASALLEHSRARPREIVAKVAGAGSFDLALSGLTPALASWADGFSAVLEIVYPYDATEQTPDALGSDEYRVVRLDTGLWLRFLSATPAVGEYALISYTAPHTLSLTLNTLADGDADAFADLVAAHACEALASLYIQSTDSSISADAVDRKSKSSEYRTQAALFRKAYGSKLTGVAVAGTGVAGELGGHFATLNTSRDAYFFHGRIYP